VISLHNAYRSAVHILVQDEIENFQVLQIQITEYKEKLDEITSLNTQLQSDISKLVVSILYTLISVVINYLTIGQK